MKQQLIDQAKFLVQAGDGGTGSIHFRRDPHTKDLSIRRLLIQPFRMTGFGEGSRLFGVI